MDKTERLLQMLEHPESCSDEQLQELLRDEECRELYETMRLCTSAFEAEDAKQKIAEGIKEEEWKKFEAKRNLQLKPQASNLKPILKLAAMFIGVLLLSGIAYAAIHYVRTAGGNEKPQQTETRIAKDVTDKPLQTQPNDSTLLKPVVFEDKELGTMLTEIAAFYQCEVVYKSDASKHVRLFFTWDKSTSIDDVIATFNKFERIHITREDQKLIVK